MASKGAQDVAPENLIVTTGSQQALDLLGKTLISPGDKVIVEGPTFLATIQCFRLYGAELISAPIDGHGVQTDELEKLIAEHKPKFVYLIPTFGNPSGALLPLRAARRCWNWRSSTTPWWWRTTPTATCISARRRRPACWRSLPRCRAAASCWCTADR
jgi:DNA-binding transcriptional MocR family regulator